MYLGLLTLTKGRYSYSNTFQTFTIADYDKTVDALRSVFDAKIFRLATLYVQLVRENTHALKPFYSSTFVSMFNRNVSLPKNFLILPYMFTGPVR